VAAASATSLVPVSASRRAGGGLLYSALAVAQADRHLRSGAPPLSRRRLAGAGRVAALGALAAAAPVIADACPVNDLAAPWANVSAPSETERGRAEREGGGRGSFSRRLLMVAFPSTPPAARPARAETRRCAALRGHTMPALTALAGQSAAARRGDLRRAGRRRVAPRAAAAGAARPQLGGSSQRARAPTSGPACWRRRSAGACRPRTPPSWRRCARPWPPPPALPGAARRRPATTGSIGKRARAPARRLAARRRRSRAQSPAPAARAARRAPPAPPDPVRTALPRDELAAAMALGAGRGPLAAAAAAWRAALQADVELAKVEELRSLCKPHTLAGQEIFHLVQNWSGAWSCSTSASRGRTCCSASPAPPAPPPATTS